MNKDRKGQAKGVFTILLGGAIAITVFALLFIYMLRGAQQSYPTVTFNESQYQSFNQTNQIVNLTQQMNDAFTGINSSGTNVGDIINVVTTGGYNTLKILGAIPAVYSGMMYSAALIIGVPVPIVSLVSFVVIAALIGLFILLVFRVYVS